MLEGRKLEFGIPKKEVKIDPFEGQSKLIIKKPPNNKGATYKFKLTKKALVDLELVRINGIDEKLVSFSFNENTLIIGNTTSLKGEIDSKNQYNVSITGIFSNKKIHNYLIDLLKLDPNQDNILDLSIIDDPNIKLAALQVPNVIVDEKNDDDNEIEENGEVDLYPPLD